MSREERAVQQDGEESTTKSKAARLAAFLETWDGTAAASPFEATTRLSVVSKEHASKEGEEDEQALGWMDTWAPQEGLLEENAVKQPALKSAHVQTQKERSYGGNFSIPSLPYLSLGESKPHVHDQAIPKDSGEEQSDLVLMESLGEGGMGQVFLAHQRSLGRDVAIKRMKAQLSSPRELRMLLHEGYVTGHLEHPSIVPVHALGRDDAERPLIVMKRIEGVSWKVLIQEPEHTFWKNIETFSQEPLMRHLEILLEVCRAVRFAHSKGILHLDIKPENVMLGAFGEVYLLDWGLARRFEGEGIRPKEEEILGTPGYMAPEQVGLGSEEYREKLGPQTDVYLLGATLHEVLTQSTRHQGRSLRALLESACLSDPVEYGPQIPRELGDLCNKATHVEPKQRFVDVQDFCDALRSYIQHRDSTALSDQALLWMGELQSLWSHEGRVAEETAQAIHRQFYECVFCFRQSLQRWPENQAAYQGLQSCLVGMIRFELRHQRLDFALRLRLELLWPDEEVSAEIEALRKEKETEEKEQAALREMAREMDPSVSRKARFWSSLSMAFFSLMIATVFSFYSFRNKASFHLFNALVIGLVMLVLAGGAFWVFRRFVFVNQFSRKFFSVIFVAIVLIIFHRMLGAYQGLSLSSVMSGDLLLAASSLGVGAVVLQRRLWLGVGIALLGAFLIGVFPAFTLPVMGITMCSLFTMMTYLAWRGE